MPLLIDVGRGTYTRKTFSDKRYDIWYNCSDYHNLPTINGKNQLPGGDYKATNVSYKGGKSTVQFMLDISKSYPADAGIISWNRTITFNRTKGVTIEDLSNLSRVESVIQHLMTNHPAEVAKPGEVVIHYKPENGDSKDFIIS